MANVYEIVTEKIIKRLEQGVIPWQIPWTEGNGAVNWVTQKAYRGINALLLDPGEYATFLQIKVAGGKIKAGQKGQIVVFYKLREVEEDTGDGDKGTKKIPLIRYSTVFEISTQCEGLTSKRKPAPEYQNNPIEEAEKILNGYKNCPVLVFAPGRAFYRPSTDTISVPEISDYKKPEEYYCTMFHEMVHSTGHKARLNRSGVTGIAAFGSETYSKEELVAEIGAAMLCGVAGIESVTIDNSAAYIQSWIRKLREDNKLIVTAAGAAQKAADYIRGINSREE